MFRHRKRNCFLHVSSGSAEKWDMEKEKENILKRKHENIKTLNTKTNDTSQTGFFSLNSLKDLENGAPEIREKTKIYDNK